MENLLEQIPKNVIEKYQITIKDDILHAHTNNSYAGIPFSKIIEVYNDDVTLTIRTNNSSVSFFKNIINLHITIL